VADLGHTPSEARGACQADREDEDPNPNRQSKGTVLTVLVGTHRVAGLVLGSIHGFT